MKKLVLVPILIASTLGVVGCSSDDATPTPDREQVGAPNPPLPAEVNAIPFTVGAVAAVGNADVRMQLADDAPTTRVDLVGPPYFPKKPKQIETNEKSYRSYATNSDDKHR